MLSEDLSASAGVEGRLGEFCPEDSSGYQGQTGLSALLKGPGCSLAVQPPDALQLVHPLPSPTGNGAEVRLKLGA